MINGLQIVAFLNLIEQKAIKINSNGKIYVNYEKTRESIKELLKNIIIMEGNGDLEGMKKFIKNYNVMPHSLHLILEKISNSKIPKDIYPIQGEKILKI